MFTPKIAVITLAKQKMRLDLLRHLRKSTAVVSVQPLLYLITLVFFIVENLLSFAYTLSSRKAEADVQRILVPSAPSNH